MKLGRPRLYDLAGQKFGHLSVVGPDEEDPKLWRCLCECGNSASLTTASLRHGGRTSCGCGLGRKSTRDPLGLRHSMVMSSTVRSVIPIEVSKAIRAGADLVEGQCPLCADIPARRLTMANGIRTEGYRRFRNDARNYLIVCESCWYAYRMVHKMGASTGMPELVATTADWLMMASDRRDGPTTAAARKQLAGLAEIYLEETDASEEHGLAETNLREYAKKILGAA